MVKRNPPELGKILQDLRKDKKLTLEKLAQSAGISKSMLSQIERGQTNPTFATLWSLTQALGIEISNILDDKEKESSSPALIEHLEGHFTPTIKSADEKCFLKILSPISSVSNLEWYEVEMEEGATLQSAAHSPSTVEHLTVLSGMLRIQAEDTLLDAHQGDTVRYRADCPHSITNIHKGKSRALLVMSLGN